MFTVCWKVRHCVDVCVYVIPHALAVDHQWALWMIGWQFPLCLPVSLLPPLTPSLNLCPLSSVALHNLYSSKITLEYQLPNHSQKLNTTNECIVSVLSALTLTALQVQGQFWIVVLHCKCIPTRLEETIPIYWPIILFFIPWKYAIYSFKLHLLLFLEKFNNDMTLWHWLMTTIKSRMPLNNPAIADPGYCLLLPLHILAVGPGWCM